MKNNENYEYTEMQQDKLIIGNSKGDKLAKISLIFGIMSLFCCGGILSLPSIVMGIIALKDNYCVNRGKAIAGIVLSSISIIVSLITMGILIKSGSYLLNEVISSII